MRGSCVIVAALALAIAVIGSTAMTYEVDALYAEDAYEPYFIEVDSMPQLEEQLPALVETEAQLENTNQMDVEADSEDQESIDAESEVDASEQEESETEEFAFTEVLDGPADANVTIPTNSTTNATFVPSNNATQQIGRNPNDPCGCWNSATCQVNVCICTSQWTGQWCERPSPISQARQTELDRLANLTSVIQRVAQQVGEIEAASGSPEAVRRLIAEAAKKEIIQMNVQKASQEFYKALGNNDMFIAKEQMNLIKYMDAEKYPAFEREFAVQEQRIASTLGAAKPGIKVMEVPVMQDLKYKDVDTTFAKDLKFETFDRANNLVEDAKQKARQFNLDFGDPL